MITALHAQVVSPHQHVHSPEAFGRFKLVACQLDLEAVGIVEIDRIHETPIPLNEVDAAGLQSRRCLHEGCPRDIERNVLDAADVPWRVPFGIVAGFVGEYREQSAIARIEVDMVLIRLAKVGLFEDERHPQRTLPEINRALFRGPDERDVMNTLHL